MCIPGISQAPKQTTVQVPVENNTATEADKLAQAEAERLRRAKQAGATGNIVAGTGAADSAVATLKKVLGG